MPIGKKIFFIVCLYVVAVASLFFTVRHGLVENFWSHEFVQTSSGGGPEQSNSEIVRHELMIGFILVAAVVAICIKLALTLWRYLVNRSFKSLIVIFPVIVIVGCGILMFLLKIPHTFLGEMIIKYHGKNFAISILVGVVVLTLLIIKLYAGLNFLSMLFHLPTLIRQYIQKKWALRRQKAIAHIQNLTEQGYFYRAQYFIAKLDKESLDTLLVKRDWARSSGNQIAYDEALGQLLERVSEMAEPNALLFEAFQVRQRKEGCFDACLLYAQRAHRHGCKAFWVYETILSQMVSRKEWSLGFKVLDALAKDDSVEESLIQNKRAALHTAQAMSLMEDGHFPEAIGAVTKALACHKDFLPALAAMCQAYAQSGQYAQAYEKLQEAWVKAYPNAFLTHVYGQLVRRQLHAAMGSPYEGEPGGDNYLLAQVLTLTQKLESIDKTEARLLVAQVALLMGDTKQARMQLYPLGQNTALNDRRICLYMAQLEEREGQKGEAITWLKRACEEGGDLACWRGAGGFKSADWVPLNPRTGFFDVLKWE